MGNRASTERSCQFDGCDQPHHCKGWCRGHYEQSARGITPRPLAGHTDEVGTCAAPTCTTTFQQRAHGSKRLYCSRKCRDRTAKAAERATEGYLPPHRRADRERCSVDGCDEGRFVHGLCVMHHERVKKSGEPGEAAARKAKPGESEWRKNGQGYVRRCRNGKAELQHRVVMEEDLGRPLLAHETPHHKNGDRSDNRIANLELWSSWQPAGQRVEDKVAWAKELLALYEPAALVPPPLAT